MWERAVVKEAMAKTSATAAEEGMDGAADGAVQEGAATTVMTAATKREAVQEGVASALEPLLLKVKLRDWISSWRRRRRRR